MSRPAQPRVAVSVVIRDQVVIVKPVAGPRSAARVTGSPACKEPRMHRFPALACWYGWPQVTVADRSMPWLMAR